MHQVTPAHRAFQIAAIAVILGTIGWLVWMFSSGSTPTGYSAVTYYVPQNAPADDVAVVSTQATTRGPSRDVSEHWVEAYAHKTAIPTPAVRAYGRAVLAEPDDCHLGWTTLAAIGLIESGHGEGQGARLSAAGISSPTITSSAGAFGPMQFIASTWDQWKSDGDGDGLANIDDINDAAVSAMRYLCSYGDLAQPATWARAIYAYNHSDAYVKSIYNAADNYAAMLH